MKSLAELEAIKNKMIEINNKGFDASNKEAETNAALKKIFRPEFLNRLDEILEFDSLSREQIREIVKLLEDDYRSAGGDKGSS